MSHDGDLDSCAPCNLFCMTVIKLEMLMIQVVLGISAFSGKSQVENSFFYPSVKGFFVCWLGVCFCFCCGFWWGFFAAICSTGN